MWWRFTGEYLYPSWLDCWRWTYWFPKKHGYPSVRMLMRGESIETVGWIDLRPKPSKKAQ